MTAVGHLMDRDSSGATTCGAVHNADGRLLGLITHRSHLLTVPEAPPYPSDGIPSPAPGTSLREALGVQENGCGAIVLPPNRYAANGMGNVHGGVLIAGMEFAAMSALGATGALRTISIDTVFVRPLDAGRTTTFRTTVRHRGRSMSVVEVVAIAETGKSGAFATVIVGGPQN
ncbi:hypothetical protein MP11Mi_23270 [Gordonia sp. MP11Mi]|uniref:Thioesterase domain-containing protein n=2 Tax=Gordonia sp. MP11Mi TaxID=3022769 RepID=A0AA97GV06_9ACTN